MKIVFRACTKSDLPTVQQFVLALYSESMVSKNMVQRSLVGLPKNMRTNRPSSGFKPPLRMSVPPHYINAWDLCSLKTIISSNLYGKTALAPLCLCVSVVIKHFILPT
ncbi:hypothetical protein NIES4071_36040 [Calothrix sp. NIES-4071]|nr:hypothetical protein NIES4071_36040 [Calothrix sp. NIES-4071]BAZ57923.1 hypothetical protein NIES4105_35970 [Calothrix sp. NIES-4105]